MASLVKTISCGFRGSTRHNILIMSAQFSVHSLFTRVQVFGPQRDHLIITRTHSDYPGEPQKTMTALIYNPFNALPYAL
ncbi:hypothetical protein ES703_44437 [subsurface metagenome]